MNEKNITLRALLSPAIAGVAVLVALVAGPAQAGPITVANFSFESPNETSSGTPPAVWAPAFGSGYAGAGLFDPCASVGGSCVTAGGIYGAGFVGGIDLTQTLYSTGWDYGQTLSALLGVGTYTLKVAIGDRGDLPLLPSVINLIAGTTVIATASAGAAYVSDGWLDLTTTATILAGNAALGSALRIELLSSGASPGQINFDNVRLDFVGPAGPQAVPEPASLALLGLGLLLLAARRQKTAA